MRLVLITFNANEFNKLEFSMLFKTLCSRVSCFTTCFIALVTSTQSLALQSSDSEALSCKASYQVRINTQTEFLFKQASVTRHKLNGFLSLKPLSNTLEDLPSSTKLVEGVTAKWWGIQLSEVEQIANQQVLPEQLIYSLPFAALRTSEGELVDFRFPVEISVTDQDKLKGAALYLQFPTSEQQVKATAQRQEVDTIGVFLADYLTELQSA